MPELKKRAGRTAAIVGLSANTSVRRYLREELGYVKVNPRFVRFYSSKEVFGSRDYFVRLIEGVQVRDLTEIITELNNSDGPILAVVILNAHRFKATDLTQFCAGLNRRGIDVVLAGKPEPEFFEVVASADIPVIDQSTPCLHVMKNGSCGRPGKNWIWYNESNYLPIIEFLKEVLQLLRWALGVFKFSHKLLEKAARYLNETDQHYPNIPEPVALFAPWDVIKWLFGNELRQEVRCRLHATGDRYEHDGFGTFTLIVGPCEAGKSTRLALEIENAELRYGAGNVMSCAALPRGSRSRVPGKYLPEHAVSVQKVLELSRERLFCFVDESELYGQELVAAIGAMIDQGKFVHAASYQVRGDLRPFANTAGLMALADSLICLSAVCEICDLPAHKTQVLVRQKGHEHLEWQAISALDFERGDWIPEDVFRENEVSFRPRCLGCHDLPDEDKRDGSLRLLNQVWSTDATQPSEHRQQAEAGEQEKRRTSLNNGYRLLAVLLLANAVMRWVLLPITIVVTIPLVFYWFWRKFAPPIGVRFRVIAAALETILVFTIGVTIAVLAQLWSSAPATFRQYLLEEWVIDSRYYATLVQIELWRETELFKSFLTYGSYWDLVTLPIPLIVSIATAIFLGIKLTRFAKRPRKRKKKVT